MFLKIYSKQNYLKQIFEKVIKYYYGREYCIILVFFIKEVVTKMKLIKIYKDFCPYKFSFKFVYLLDLMNFNFNNITSHTTCPFE